ncbi:MAG: beta-lactamase family protein [Planctomycetia bacterium]|nr:beta-lactamase family protein [Planctomycetia bacterium]
MRLALRRLALLVLVLLSAQSTRSAYAGDADPAKLGKIRAAMQAFVDDQDLAGAVTVVGRKNGVVSLEAVGSLNLEKKQPMVKDSIFRIASMTKPITAIGIMILADEGKLSVEDPVEKYLPEFKGQMLISARSPDAVTLKKPARPITLRDLLTHTSGLTGALPPAVSDLYVKRNRTLAEATLVYSQRPLEFEPGSKWSYCNPGIDTLGRVIEVVSGHSYEDFLRKRVFEPLGMNDTTFYPTPAQLERCAITYLKKDGQLTPSPNTLIDLPKDPKFPIPAGGLYSTGPDLAKLYQMMLNQGTLGKTRILSPESVAAMTKVQTGELTTGFTAGMGFGFGWAVVRQPQGITEMLSAGTYGHGGAYGTQGWLDPNKDLFLILLIQRTGLPNSDASKMRQQFQELAVAGVK